MATRIEIDYDRVSTDASLAAMVARAAATLNVMQQLGVAYQSLPGIAMADYQVLANALEALVAQYNALLDQIRPLLIAMDDAARPLDEMSKRALGALRGLLRSDADIALLDQITGPQPQGPTPPAPPPGP